jgi:hypothetical protein
MHCHAAVTNHTIVALPQYNTTNDCSFIRAVLCVTLYLHSSTDNLKAPNVSVGPSSFLSERKNYHYSLF